MNKTEAIREYTEKAKQVSKLIMAIAFSQTEEEKSVYEEEKEILEEEMKELKEIITPSKPNMEEIEEMNKEMGSTVTIENGNVTGYNPKTFDELELMEQETRQSYKKWKEGEVCDTQ